MTIASFIHGVRMYRHELLDLAFTGTDASHRAQPSVQYVIPRGTTGGLPSSIAMSCSGAIAEGLRSTQDDQQSFHSLVPARRFHAIFAKLSANGGKPDQLMIDATHLKPTAPQPACSRRGCSPTYGTYQRLTELEAQPFCMTMGARWSWWLAKPDE